MASTSAVTLDDLASSTSPTLDSHLFFPPPDVKDPVEERSKSPVELQSRQLLKDRLYIGNLHPTVDEYTLLQVFSKFGKVTKLDYLFHKTGLLKGKPRGYAFIEYGNSDVSCLSPCLYPAPPPPPRAHCERTVCLLFAIFSHSMLAPLLATIICGRI
ncbi:hypothetical protein CPB84DRAFT_1674389 [Gymnopilus junonius]|uniref:RRM domain-containing protein n=1 Tax=Gymnopilus junonius TaxID=109634 RepID=A0A9P5NXQ2_GYMJU|nr:hypothetical protein CPB84DRAFT_1674389 [Gymnopilus junonius]